MLLEMFFSPLDILHIHTGTALSANPFLRYHKNGQIYQLCSGSRHQQTHLSGFHHQFPQDSPRHHCLQGLSDLTVLQYSPLPANILLNLHTTLILDR